MKEVKFEVMPMSWVKRRPLTDVPPSVTSVEVIGFKQINNHCCTLIAAYDDGTVCELSARVSYSCTYGTDGTHHNERWTVSGINSTGQSALVKMLLVESC